MKIDSMGAPIKAGIAGAAGYTGGELIRILLCHPQVELVFAQSKSNAGNLLGDVHADLAGDTGMKFSAALSDGIDVLFLCMGHGESGKFLKENRISEKVRIIDLSNDFRLKENASADGRTFIYGLPELNRPAIQKAQTIANPGCFATAIQLALLPLAGKQLLNSEVHVSAVTGSTGAGQALSATSHFTWRNNNVSVYKAFTHQHLAEIGQSLKQLQSGFNKEVNFIPYRGNFTRGILAAVYAESDLKQEELTALYQSYYKGHPFVTLVSKSPDIKQVVNTNKCLLYIEKHGNKVLIQSVIDNLTKGASGQAVQNMNLMFGFEETSGLRFKASAF